MIRVLLAEDQAMVRGALAALLSREQDIEVVAEVARGDEVVQAALATQPDVALLDIEMPGGDGLAATQALRNALPTCRSVILTTFGRSGYLRRAMESGAVGFLLKDPPGLCCQREPSGIIFPQPCRNWAHTIGWKRHASLSKGDGYEQARRRGRRS